MTPSLVISGLGLANPFVGQGVYALRLLEGLRRRRPDLAFRVLAPASFTALRDLLTPEEFVPLAGSPPHPHELVAHPYWMNRLAARAQRDFPDAVFHSPSPFWALAQPARSIVTLHDCIYRTFRKYLGQFVVRRLLVEATERWAARARTVLTDSEFSATDLAERTGIPREQIRVLFPWVDERSFEPRDEARISALRERLGLPERFWLYLGGYDYRKNVEFLISSYAVLHRSHPWLPPLVLAGRIPTGRSDVSCDVAGAIRAAGLPADALLMPGLIEHADLPDLYRAASLLIYPSLMEGFGLPPAEAMAVGTPLLVADASSLPEVVRRSECRFDPRDESGLVARLRAAAENEGAFRCAFPPEFREDHGISAYLGWLGIPRVP